MRIAVFNTKPYDECFLTEANRRFGYELSFFEAHLNHKTVQLAAGYDAVCIFVNDVLDRELLVVLRQNGTGVVLLRCAGYNNVDLEAAAELGMIVARVPSYSPHAVAEHAMALILTLDRKTHRAYNRIREGNFSLEGLLGFDLYQKTVGIIGTGQIGTVMAGLVSGFGCRVLAYDMILNPECVAKGVTYVSMDELLTQSDIISLHCPLTPETRHLINEEAISKMKEGAMLINTSRGGIIDTQAVIDGLKSGRIGALGLDVYEGESELFFEDLSSRVIQDDVFTRLLTFPNVLITGHQAFFTKEALQSIAETTLSNLKIIQEGRPCPNEVCVTLAAS
jgi:D-lactate dehydrogenase